MSQRNLNNLNHWLIHHAARRAPESLSQRLEEEWLADMAERPSAFSRLRFAMGCCWATRVIAYEHQPSTVAASAATPRISRRIRPRPSDQRLAPIVVAKHPRCGVRNRLARRWPRCFRRQRPRRSCVRDPPRPEGRCWRRSWTSRSRAVVR